jgi:LysR family glycine cleavage system transcriptional activator
MTNLPPAALPAFAVFVVAARHQNFARAADELGLTASAVSHHVRTLESTLGIALFQRHARGASLTTEGRMLAESVGAALSDIDSTAASLRRGKGEGNRLRVATLHSLTHCWILPRLKTFTAAHPRIRLTFESGLALTRFESGGPELAIRHGAGYWQGLTAHHIMDEELFPAAAADFPGVRESLTAAHPGTPDARDSTSGRSRARSSPRDARPRSAVDCTPAEIATLPLVTDLGIQGWTDWFRAAGLRGVVLPDMHTFNDSTDALQAAACGLGIVLARSRLVGPYLRRGELVRLPGPALKARFGYYAVHPAHRRPSAAATAFIQWLQNAARQP